MYEYMHAVIVRVAKYHLDARAVIWDSRIQEQILKHKYL